MAGRIIQVFMNVSMINGHDGLAEIAKAQGIKTNEIDPGSYVVFVNSAKDRIKVYAAGQTVAYVRLEKGRKVDLRVIREIPNVFRGGKIEYDKALEVAIDKVRAREGKEVLALG